MIRGCKGREIRGIVGRVSAFRLALFLNFLPCSISVRLTVGAIIMERMEDEREMVETKKGKRGG